MPDQQPPAVTSYQYDALDRLSSHRRVGGLHRQCFYCGHRLVTETQGAEQLSIIQYGDRLLAARHCHDDHVAKALLTTDQQRSVLNALQSSRQRVIAYSPYGHRALQNGLSSFLGFNGQRPDPATGHYLLGNGYRAFNPVLMRFNSPDNLGPFGKGGLNTYAYCHGDPVNRSDATGHFSSVLSQYLSRIEAQIQSLKIGVKLKPVANVTRLSEGIFTFEDKDGSRLTFEAHGSPGGLTEGFSGIELVGLAKQHGVNVEKFDRVRLVICHSASVEKNGFGIADISFAEGFNRLVKRPVKGYQGKVVSVDTPRVFEELKIGETYAGPYYFGVVKKGLFLHKYGDGLYRPVIFDKVKKSTGTIRGN
jgi:RHS repeat-associated protein